MTVVCQLMTSLSIKKDYQTFVFHHSNNVNGTVVGVVIAIHYVSATSTIHVSPRNLSWLKHTNIILEKLIKYNTTHLSINAQLINYWFLSDYCLNHSIILQSTIAGTVIVVHYFWVRSTIHFSPRSWYGLGQINIILENLMEYNISVVYQWMPILSIDYDYQTFFFHDSIIV